MPRCTPTLEFNTILPFQICMSPDGKIEFHATSNAHQQFVFRMDSKWFEHFVGQVRSLQAELTAPGAGNHDCPAKPALSPRRPRGRQHL